MAVQYKFSFKKLLSLFISAIWDFFSNWYKWSQFVGYIPYTLQDRSAFSVWKYIADNGVPTYDKVKSPFILVMSEIFQL
jgi:hypothetical protein